MKIELREIPIREIVKGYKNSAEEGVTGYSGRLNIRPKYQREFVYKDKQRDAVIRTIRSNCPLNTIYWSKNDHGTPEDETDDTYELLDGQQRTISICEYVSGTFSIDYQYFHNLGPEAQNQILDYPLMIYFCEGTDKEKLEWFKVINIAGEKLTNQELRNAVYSGSWITDAKKYFSKTNCPAYNLAERYLKGSSIRQDYLETILEWISEGNIEDYMARNQYESNASSLWLYMKNVISWTETIFRNYRKEMKGVPFGLLYNKFKDVKLDPYKIEKEISRLMQDEDVTKKAGIYEYILTGKEKHLSIRTFSSNQKRESYERQVGLCPACNNHFAIEDMEADHINPWSKGGKTISENCRMLCKECNREKSNK